MIDIFYLIFTVILKMVNLYIEKWNEHIKYMTSHTRFNLATDCPNGLITAEVFDKIRNYLISINKWKVLPSPGNDQLMYVHDGIKIVNAVKKYSTDELLKTICDFVRTSSGDNEKIIAEAMITEYKKYNLDIERDVTKWRDLWKDMPTKHRYTVLKIAYSLIDKSKFAHIDETWSIIAATHEA